jgi:hypothetical protein
VTDPEPAEGFFSFVDGGSSMSGKAYSFDERKVRTSLERHVLWRLRAVLGAKADELDLARLPAPQFVRRAMHADHSQAAGEEVAGPVINSAWVLWQVPRTALLDLVPENLREAATSALERAEPTTAPDWTRVEEEPSWARGTPAADRDAFVVVVKVESFSRAVAEANAQTGSLGMITDVVIERLGRGGLKTSDLPREVHHAASRAIMKERAYLPKRRLTTAWVRWEVPLAPILEALPPAQRSAARAALRRPS